MSFILHGRRPRTTVQRPRNIPPFSISILLLIHPSGALDHCALGTALRVHVHSRLKNMQSASDSYVWDVACERKSRLSVALVSLPRLAQSFLLRMPQPSCTLVSSCNIFHRLPCALAQYPLLEVKIFSFAMHRRDVTIVSTFHGLGSGLLPSTLLKHP